MSLSQPAQHYFSDDFVQQVRQGLVAFVNQQQPSQIKSYDQTDIDRLLQDDGWFIRRHLVEKPSTTVPVAVSKVYDALVWRHKFGICQLHDAMFPAEFYKSGVIFQYGEDKTGNLVLIFRIRLNQPPPGVTIPGRFKEMVQKYIIHRMEGVIGANPNRKFALVMDFQKATYANADLKLARFLVHTFTTYYYDLIIWGCAHEMPWIFNKVWQLVRLLLNEDQRRRVHFTTKHDITKYIERQHLPDFMGGTGDGMSYRAIPEGVPGVVEWGLEHGFVTDREQAVKCKEQFDYLCTL